jgi:flagellar assembly protein FliH
MNNTSNPDVMIKSAQKSNQSAFLDLYEKHKSKIVANSAQPVSPEQLKIIYEKAYQNGYAEGEREAKDNVMLVVHEELAEVKNSMHCLMAGFKAAITHHADRTSEEMLSLALEISKTMVHAEIRLNRDIILQVIRQALTRLPSVQMPIKIMVHPDDEALVMSHMQDIFAGVCDVNADPSVERGGCVVESESNSIDATNATRWRLICQSLGYADPWIQGESNAD